MRSYDMHIYKFLIIILDENNILKMKMKIVNLEALPVHNLGTSFIILSL